jgi:hypothetical protein
LVKPEQVWEAKKTIRIAKKMNILKEIGKDRRGNKIGKNEFGKVMDTMAKFNASLME